MSARRLTDADKRQIVDLYRNPGETAATLAEQFGVSNTTIGRILKAGMEVTEYDQLVQQKRRGTELPADESSSAIAETPVVQPTFIEDSAPENSAPSERQSRRRPTPVSPTIAPEETELPYSTPLETPARRIIQVGTKPAASIQPPQARMGRTDQSQVNPLEDGMDDDLTEDLILTPVTEEIAAILEEDFETEEVEVDDLDEDDDEDDDDDDEDDLDLADEDVLSLQSQSSLRVRPFEEAEMPRICYLVVDRAADLVVRPLEDFGALGLSANPTTLTLPIFDNHRVAKRFATDRSQRVIKVPDSQVFYKTAFQLRAKGITHLFIDGQIYVL